MNIAFIPARGGSKRLPRKNLQHLDGRPLLEYSIALAHAEKSIDACVVSTDDEEIAAVAQKAGAQVIMRPPELARDDSTTAAAAQHALEQLDQSGTRAEVFITLQPNCPLRPLSMLQDALELFHRHRNETDSVVPVVLSHYKLGAIESGLFVPHYRPGTPSQNMEPRYYEAALVLITRADVVRAGDVFGARIRPLLIDALYARGDIEDEIDLEIAEFLFQKYRAQFDYV